MFITALQTYFKKWFEKSKYEFERPLPVGKNIKLIALMKHAVGGDHCRICRS